MLVVVPLYAIFIVELLIYRLSRSVRYTYTHISHSAGKQGLFSGHQQRLGGVENNINEMIKLAAVCQFVALWERVEERTGRGPLSVVAVDRIYTRVLTHQHG